MKTLFFASSMLLLSLNNALADIPAGTGRLPTVLTSGELQREASDAQLYHHTMEFLRTVDISKRIFATDPRNAALVHASHYFDPSFEMWTSFWKAAATDHLTCLRAFGLMSREIKKRGYIVWGSAAAFERSVAENKVDLGLAMPARNIGAAVWAPDPSNTDPEFQLHMKLFYTEPFIHKFPDHILPANLKIGYGPEMSYWIDGKEYRQHTVDTDLFYGAKQGVGFRNVKGIGGQKRGFLGFMQKVLFFLPDAIHSMTIDEQKGAMVTEAMMNTTVPEFEKNPIYSVKVGQ